MVFEALRCFSSLRKYWVFFSHSSIHLNLDLTCAPCICFISCSSRCFFRWSVCLCNSLFWGSDASCCSVWFSSSMSFWIIFFLFLDQLLVFCRQKVLNFNLNISHATTGLSFWYSPKCVSIKFSVSFTNSISDNKEELNFQKPGPLLKLLVFTWAFTSLWSEYGKLSMLEVVIFVSEVESQRI